MSLGKLLISGYGLIKPFHGLLMIQSLHISTTQRVHRLGIIRIEFQHPLQLFYGRIPSFGINQTQAILVVGCRVFRMVLQNFLIVFNGIIKFTVDMGSSGHFQSSLNRISGG